MIRFRDMVPEDLDQVFENEIRAYQFPWTRRNFEDCLAARNLCRIATLGERVIGHGIVGFGAGEAHLLNVCIRRDHQGRGFGRQLVEHMLGGAQGCGAGMVFLEVRPSNLTAVTLYASLGFNEIGVRRNYYPSQAGHEDALIMALDLRAFFPPVQV